MFDETFESDPTTSRTVQCKVTGLNNDEEVGLSNFIRIQSWLKSSGNKFSSDVLYSFPAMSRLYALRTPLKFTVKKVSVPTQVA